MKRTIKLNECQLRRIVSESVKRVLREGYNNFDIGKACDFRDTMDFTMNGGSKYNIYTVFVGGGEVNDYLLSYEDAVKLAREYADEGYDDVQVVNTKTNKVEKF